MELIALLLLYYCCYICKDKLHMFLMLALVLALPFGGKIPQYPLDRSLGKP